MPKNFDSKFVMMIKVLNRVLSSKLHSVASWLHSFYFLYHLHKKRLLILLGRPCKRETVFNQNCAACHALNRKMTGPALANVETRLAEEEV